MSPRSPISPPSSIAVVSDGRHPDMPPPGHTPFSWHATLTSDAVPPGHTPFSWLGWRGDCFPSPAAASNADQELTPSTLPPSPVRASLLPLSAKQLALAISFDGSDSPIDTEPQPPAATPVHAPEVAPSVEDVEDPTTNGKVLALLSSQLGPAESRWSTLTHEPTPTSEDSARVRSATLASGAKAMLLSVKPGDTFVLVVISASEKMDSKAMKKAGGFKVTTGVQTRDLRIARIRC